MFTLHASLHISILQMRTDIREETLGKEEEVIRKGNIQCRGCLTQVLAASAPYWKESREPAAPRL